MNEKEFLTLGPAKGFCALIALSAARGAFKRVTLSGPLSADKKKAQMTLRSIGSRTMLQLETFHTDNKAKHQNIALDDMDALLATVSDYRQINLVTTLKGGESAELKRASSGKLTLLRGVALFRLLDQTDATEQAVASDRDKNRILRGDEPFLRALGISDERGRVHDKKQSKFRQINRFLELLRDVEGHLPSDGALHVCDLCCGKSYLSFAVYHYLTAVKGREVVMECVDLKSDVIAECAAVAGRLGYDGLHFICGDVGAFTPSGEHVHLVVSLHACDTATDLVLGKAMEWQSEVILSTPCCHHELNHTLDCPELECIAEHSMLRQKLCDAATDAMRLLLLKANGYAATALELIDPEETPKNVMLRAVRKKKTDPASLQRAREDYEAAVRFFIRNEGNAQQAFLERGNTKY